ncbi:MAG: hypothetical protein ACYTDY_03455, partial [Planctomycetota bacterium]
LADGHYGLRASAGDRRGADHVYLRPDGVFERITLDLSPGGPLHSLTGRVIAADGGPFEGVVATVQDLDFFWPEERPVRVGRDGEFTVEGLSPGLARVSVMTPGSLFTQAEPVKIPHPADLVIDLSTRLAPVSVTVLDVEGRRLPDAEVALDSWDPTVRSRAKTGPEGTCTVYSGPEPSRMTVSAEGFRTARPDPRNLPEPLVVKLRRGSEIRARVVRASDGAPVEGAVVQVLGVRIDGQFRSGAKAETDAEGRVRLTGVLPGETAVFVAGGGWFSEDLVATDHPTYWAPREGALEVELPAIPALTIVGIVTAADGTPVEGALVQYHVSGAGLSLLARHAKIRGAVASDGSGRFRIAGLIPGAGYQIRAQAPDHPRAGNVLFVARPGVEPRVVFPLAHRVEVHVIERGSGLPLAGIRVHCGRVHDATDADGKARIGPVPAGKHRVGVFPLRHLEPESVKVVAGEPISPILFELSPGASIFGRAVLPDGTAPEEGDVEADGGGHDELDPDGRFEIHALRPGKYELNVWANVGERRFEGSIMARAGGDEDEVVVRLEEVEDFEPVLEYYEVRVLDPDGRPVPSAFAAERGGTVVKLRWITSGAFLASAKSAGGTLLVAHARDGSGLSLGAGALVVPLPDEPREGWEVRLPPEKTVSGRILDQDGEPVAGVRVLAYHGEPPHSRSLLKIGRRWSYERVHGVARSLADGTFLVEGLGDLQYRLAFEVPREYRPRESVPVTPGARDVEVRLQRGISPVITVLDPDGAPVLGARVDITTPVPTGGWRMVAFAVTDARGTVAFGALTPAERYRLSVRPPALRPSLIRIDREWEPTAEQTIELARKWVASGTVVDWNGKPLAGTSVWCRGKHRSWSRAETDAAGAFRFAGLEAEAVDLVVADAPGGVVSRGDLDSGAVRVARADKPVRLVVPEEACLVLGIPELAGKSAKPDLRTEEGHRHGARERGAGTFLFTGLVPGRRYDVWLRLPDRNLVGYRTGLVAGGKATLGLVEGTPLTGRCVAEDVTSYEDLEVVFRARGRKVKVEGKLDGTFTIPCLPRVEGEVEAEIFGSIPHDLHLKGKARAVPGTRVEVRLTPVD